MLENCLNCGEKLVQTPGKRKKKYCNSTCRSGKWHHKVRRAEKRAIRASPAKSPVKKKTAVKVSKKASNTVLKVKVAPVKSNGDAPVRQEGESALDFASRKNSWKRKNVK